MMECLQDKRLQLLGNLERIKKSTWSSNYETFKIIGIFLSET